MIPPTKHVWRRAMFLSLLGSLVLVLFLAQVTDACTSLRIKTQDDLVF